MIAMVLKLQNLLSSLLVSAPDEAMAGEDIYVVLTVTMVLWIGLFLYLIFVDKKLNGLKQRVKMLD